MAARTIIIIGVSLLASAAHASDDQDFEARLSRLEARLDVLQADDLDRLHASSAAVRALIDDILEDADARTQRLDADADAGWDGGFFLRSTDGNFSLQVGGRLQVRFVYNRRDSPDRDRWGFEVRRLRLDLAGHVVDPRLQYRVQLANTGTGGTRLNDSFVRWAPAGELAIRAGRYRPPLLREERVSSKRQLAAERSLVRSAFIQQRAIGIEVAGRHERLRWQAALMDDNGGGLDEDEIWLASTRLEVLLGGRWSHLTDFTSFPTDEGGPTLALGGGVLYRDDDAAGERRWRWTADASGEWAGVNAFVAFVGNHTDGVESLDQYGLVVQGGVFVTSGVELFARYEWGDSDTAAPDLSVVTVGVNGYIARHDLKWTVDVGYGLDEVAEFWASSGAGWRADEPGDDGQIVVRTQFQLIF
ncbi:MAG: porin [Planctomycetota bacterium]